MGYVNGKYGTFVSKADEIAQLRNAESTPLEIAKAVYGMDVTKDQFDFVIATLADYGINVSDAYAASLWATR